MLDGWATQRFGPKLRHLSAALAGPDRPTFIPLAQSLRDDQTLAVGGWGAIVGHAYPFYCDSHQVLRTSFGGGRKELCCVMLVVPGRKQLSKQGPSLDSWRSTCSWLVPAIQARGWPPGIEPQAWHVYCTSRY